MTKLPAWRQALKDHGRVRPLDLDLIPAAVTDLMDESDRTAIILCGTWLEDGLTDEIVGKMPNVSHANKTSMDLLFGIEAPIGTFSAKIRLAYALGILDDRAVAQFDLFREIRNAAAHSRLPTSFSTPAIKGACEQLCADLSIRTSAAAPSTRELFVTKWALLHEYLLDGRWRTSSEDIVEIIGDSDEPPP